MADTGDDDETSGGMSAIAGYLNPFAPDATAARSSIDGPPLELLERVTPPCYARRHEYCPAKAYNVG